MRRILLASAAALALSIALPNFPALATTTTTTVTLSTTAYTDLGVGPMYLSAGGGEVIYQTADSGPPSTVTAGHSVLPGEEARFFQTTSHVWALASTSAARAIVSSGSGIAAAGGGGGGTVTVGPYAYTPLTPMQPNLAIVSATGLTIPAGATYAVIQAATAAVKYTTDGTTTPTSSVGMTLSTGSSLTLSGATVLANFKAISATGTIDVEYYK